jgi:hypothetical protein
VGTVGAVYEGLVVEGAGAGTGAGLRCSEPQALRIPAMISTDVARTTRCKRMPATVGMAGQGRQPDMGLILFEALMALALFVFFVWWTMFSGRRGGEPLDHASSEEPGHDKGGPLP